MRALRTAVVIVVGLAVILAMATGAAAAMGGMIL